MSTTIRVRCTDQVLTYENTPVIASGGREVDSVHFEFCEKWAGTARTAVFWRSPEEAYHVPLGEDNTCAIPHEVLQADGLIYFGIFGVYSDGRQRPTDVLTYRVVKGTITEGTKPTDPTPEYYEQLLAIAADCFTRTEEIHSAYKSGELKGDKGDTGETGPQGVSGVYVGTGEMPEGYNVQIDPTGSATPGGGGGGTVQSVNGVEPDESGNVFLYGETVGTITVVDEDVTAMSLMGNVGGFIQNLDHSIFVENAGFDVWLNDVLHIGVCSYNAPQTNADGSPPMLIMTKSGNIVAMVGFMEGMGNGIMFSNFPVEAGDTVSLKITQQGEVIQKIPAKYLDVPTVDEVKAMIDEYIEEALGGEY